MRRSRAAVHRATTVASVAASFGSTTLTETAASVQLPLTLTTIVRSFSGEHHVNNG